MRAARALPMAIEVMASEVVLVRRLIPAVPARRGRAYSLLHKWSLVVGGKHHRSIVSSGPPWRRCYCSSSSRNFQVLHRSWMLPHPHAEIHQVSLLPPPPGESSPFPYSFSINTGPCLGCLDESNSNGGRDSSSSFYVIRDDLLHPLVNGNKARKLDAVLPLLLEHSVTDVVTCGGCQSAHTAATERGIKSHLLLRGEQPEVPTGYNLLSLMYGNVNYIPRSRYAMRDEMLREHADLVAGSHASVHLLDDLLDKSSADLKHNEAKPVSLISSQSVLSQPGTNTCWRKVIIVNEGAGGTTALLGVIRLVEYLSQSHLFGTKQPIKIVLDAGTGTTAIGLGLGVTCLGLPWKIVGVMLADTIEVYKKREKQLTSDFKRKYGLENHGNAFQECEDGIVQWVERIHMRKFGKVLEGEIDMCQQIAQQSGILVDPVYTLAAWEQAVLLSQADFEVSKVVMLHTGGTLGMFGLAQRYKSCFQKKGKKKKSNSVNTVTANIET